MLKKGMSPIILCTCQIASERLCRYEPARRLTASTSLRHSHASQQITEARVRAQRVYYRCHLEIRHQIGALLISLLQPGKGSILVAEASINMDHRHRRHIAALVE